MKRIFLISLFSFAFFILSAQLRVGNLLCEGKSNPLGVDNQTPRLSWKLQTSVRNVFQIAYELRWSVVSDQKLSNWSKQKVNSDQSVNVSFSYVSLKTAQTLRWQVRVWDNYGNVSQWSNEATWTMGLLQSTDWKAQWISAKGLPDSPNRPSPILMKQFIVQKKVKRALLFITAHGMYESRINGTKSGEAFLTPGWTSYKKRLQYQVYDVSKDIHIGKNILTALLGSGWYRGYIGFEGNKNVFGKDLSLLCQLDLEFNGGDHMLVVSDSTWKWTSSGVLTSELYNGEVQNTNLPINELNESHPLFPIDTSSYSKDNLIATYNETVMAHEQLQPIRIIHSPAGEQIIDFGQNMVGWVRISLNGTKGQKIILSHAEVLDKKGNFYTENLRSAREQNIYILRGGHEILEPHFTFQGFRYVKVEGWAGNLDMKAFTGVVLYSNMPLTGTFSCSSPMINQLQHNILWAQKGNFLDVPTDCPQRDERLGWTGDAQVFSRTASFNYQVLPFFTKWLKDISADQTSDGMVPFVVPNVLGADAGGAAGWGDVATIIPWNMYLAYGDTQLLRQQYPSMKAWVEFMRKTSINDLWTRGNVFGDWLFYRPFDDNDGRSAVTDKTLISESFFIHSTDLLIKAAEILNKSEDVSLYSKLVTHLRKIYLNEFVTPSGRLVSNTQTAYILALQFEILPEELRHQAAERLVQNIKDYNYHLTTGFLGTPYLCEVLTNAGFPEIAYRLLLQDTYPSWLYPVKMGATTIWERWDGQRPDSSFENAGMNSFNHYAYGAIGDWLYRYVAGIDVVQDGPGYKHIQMKPYLGDSLRSVSAELETNYGTVRSNWIKQNQHWEWNIMIPPNSRATIYIPVNDPSLIDLDGKPIVTIKNENNWCVWKAGSGTYHLTIRMNDKKQKN